MDPVTQTLALVQKSLEDLEEQRSSLSTIIRRCIRIARLRNDHKNLWWLETELVGSKEQGRIISQEIAAHFSKAEYRELASRYVDLYVEERTIETAPDGKSKRGGVLATSVEAIEEQVESFNKQLAAAVPPPGLHPQDLYLIEQDRAKVRAILTGAILERKGILSRIRQRVHHFLSTTEKELLYGQLNADIFEQNRRFVDLKLRELAPDALEKLVSAYRRLSENDAEARAQAMTSCRRVLKAIADRVYPPRPEPIKGADGKVRDLGEEKYVARLWQFVTEKLGSRTSSKVFVAAISDLGVRVDRIYELSCKGVHDEVSSFEVNQCVIQTYLLVGDVLRLADSDSGAEEEDGESV